MMKKRFLMACSVVAALLMGACSEDDLVKSKSGNTVAFDVTIPELAVATRAVGDGSTATTLYYGVYDHNAKLLSDISKPTGSEGVKMENGSAKVTLTLAKDKKYSIIFWAANADNSMCTVDWTGRTMTVNPVYANQEAYDAFCSYEVLDNVSGYMTRDVKLRRPFAQLNIGTADIAQAGASGLTVHNTKVEIAGLPTTYNFVDGTTDEPTATFAYGYPVAPVSFDGEEFPIEDATYDYLSMNYALVSADKKLVDVIFTYIDDDNQEHIRTYSSVPVQRNWRTNIYGNILTSDADFTVTIVPEFDGNHNVNVWDGKTLAEPAKDETNKTLEIHNAAELAWLAASVSGGETYAGWTVALAADIDLGGEQWTPIGKSEAFEGTFDGKGHTVSNLKYSFDGDDYFVGLFGCLNNATVKDLTINNACINLGGEDTWGHIGAIAGWVEGTSLIENIVVKGSVKIEGEMTQEGSSRIGAVVGGNQGGNVTLKNVTVEADENSYVKGNSHVGGIAGQLQGQASFENCSSNIDVAAYKFFAGGVIGCAAVETAFNGCSTSGDVSVLAGRAGNANDLYRVGGIAGGWADGKEAVLKLANCSYTGTLSGKDANGATAAAFDCGGYVGRGYAAAAGATVSVNGKSYVYQGNGVYLVDGVYEVSSCEGLQSILDNKEITGDVKIALVANLAGDVTVLQKEGVNLVIDGRQYKYDGKILVNGNARSKGEETLMFTNINFETASAEGFTFVEAPSKVNNKYNYSHNVTFDNCTFTYTGSESAEIGSASFTGTYNLVMKNCTATNMHSILQTQSCDNNVTVDNVTTVNCKNGVSFGNTAYPKLSNSTINATGYGVRADGNASRGNLIVENTTVTAEKPVIVRKLTTKTYNVTLDDKVALNTSAAYHVVFTKGEDDAEYVAPTGTYTITGAENYLVYPRDKFVASWEEFTAALADGATVVLTEDITYDKSYDLKKNVTINLNGKSLEISDPSLMLSVHSQATILNGTIKGKVYARKGADITFDGVTFGGSINGGGSTEGLLQIQPACDVYAKDCSFNATNSGTQKSRPLSVEGRSSGTLKFESCSFKSNANQNQVYVNPLGGSATLDFTGCNFNNKTPNIMLAAACPFTNLTMTGTTKLSSVTLEINRAKDAVTDTDLAYLKEMIANNSFSSVRVFYAGGSSEYIR